MDERAVRNRAEKARVCLEFVTELERDLKERAWSDLLNHGGVSELMGRQAMALGLLRSRLRQAVDSEKLCGGCGDD